MEPTDDDLAYFRTLPGMSERDVEALAEIASLETVPPGTELTVEGASHDRLHYVLEGEMLLEKAGRIRRLAPGIFVGELSFVLDEPASATVTLDEGGRCWVWNAPELRGLMERNEAVAEALDAAFKVDMARKVARS